MVRFSSPQSYHGDIEYNTNHPPQSSLDNGGVIPVESFNEITEEEENQFFSLLFDDGVETGNIIVDETCRTCTFDNLVADETGGPTDNMISDEGTGDNNMVILTAGPTGA